MAAKPRRTGRTASSLTTRMPRISWVFKVMSDLRRWKKVMDRRK